MQANDTNEYTILIAERQRRVLTKALDEFVQRHIGSSEIPGEELQEAMELSACLDSADAPLATQGLNDLTTIF